MFGHESAIDNYYWKNFINYLKEIINHLKIMFDFFTEIKIFYWFNLYIRTSTNLVHYL